VSSLTRRLGEVQCGHRMPRPIDDGVTTTRTRCVGADTRVRAAGRRWRCLLLVFVGLALGCVRAFAAQSGSDSSVALNAKVVWISSDRVLLASNDSLGVEEWDSLQFFDGKKSIASGVVTRIYEPGLAGARVTSGSLQRVKKLDRLRVLASHPGAPAPSLLRFGYPSGHRTNALFRCAATLIRIPSGYGIDPSDGRRLIRHGLPDPPWPDTLVAQEFDESGDEEIAFERGELDIAIFWPGELSARERESLDRRNQMLMPRATGVLAAVFMPSQPNGASGTVSVDSTGLAAINRDLFGGDLAMVSGNPGVPDPSGSRGTARVQVDRGCPGWDALERSLNKPPRPIVASMERGSIRVLYLDRSSDGAPPDSATTWLFRVRCPLLFTPSLRRVLERWHGTNLVDLLECQPPGGWR